MSPMRPEITRLVCECGQQGIPTFPEARLSDYTTFCLGGPCRCLCQCRYPDQVEDLVRYLNLQKLDFIVIGGGSNLLVSDDGFDGVVIRYWTDVPQIEGQAAALKVTASTRLDEVVAYAAAQGWAGMNFLSGIYGTVGGAIAGNAGAFGRQISDCLSSVVLMDRAGQSRIMNLEALKFGYRDSLLKSNGAIALEAVFALTIGDKEELLKERQEILSLREQKHPDLRKNPSAGSFFKNVVGPDPGQERQAVGWFLEQAGAKQMRCNGAGVFEKHANMIIKQGDCSAQDVFTLAGTLADKVKKKFDIDLIREVRLVGYFKGDAPSLPWIR